MVPCMSVVHGVFDIQGKMQLGCPQEVMQCGETGLIASIVMLVKTVQLVLPVAWLSSMILMNR